MEAKMSDMVVEFRSGCIVIRDENGAHPLTATETEHFKLKDWSYFKAILDDLVEKWKIRHDRLCDRIPLMSVPGYMDDTAYEYCRHQLDALRKYKLAIDRQTRICRAMGEVFGPDSSNG